jgi:Uncharacterized protein conserved in bacteria
MAEPESLSIEIAYALPQRQELVYVQLPTGSTVQQAIEASGLMQKYAEIDLKQNKVGVFGKLTKLDAPLRNRDRVEIYRPLLADPKEVRKKRADEGKAMKKGGGRPGRLGRVYLHQDSTDFLALSISCARISSSRVMRSPVESIRLMR